jgi:hypothetical protein
MSSQSHPDQSADGPAEGPRRPEPSRRSVLYGAAGLAGAGLAATAVAGTLAVPAAAAGTLAVPAAAAGARADTGPAARAPGPDEPVIVHVRDLASGEMDVFAGEARTRLRDPGLAARLVRPAR